MSSMAISLITLLIIVGATRFGMFLRTLLDEHHLSADSRDVMKLGTAMIATLASLVLGLLTASAKGTFDTVNNGVIQIASQITLLDRTMARYGLETREARNDLRQVATTTIEGLWPTGTRRIALDKVGHGARGIEDLEQKLRQLSPRNDEQSRLQSQALQITGENNATRLVLIQHVGQRSFPMPLLAVLVSWLAIIFSSFGLLTPRNTTVMAVLFVCALAAASSLFLILELDQPFGGLIKISNAPMLNALSQLGR